ncbi:hypothetical protein NKH77_00565 [Streptomyces sp. M19]
MDCAAEDHYLGSFAIGPYTGAVDLPVDVYVQAHPGVWPDCRPVSTGTTTASWS